MPTFKTCSMPGKNALKELDRLTSEFPKTGLYPVLLGDGDKLELAFSGLDKDFDMEETINESEKINVSKWFQNQGLDDLKEVERNEEVQGATMPIVTHLDVLTGKPLAKVTFAMLPVSETWQVFAHLNWGNWNGCPAPEEHCAIHRYWEKKFGAKVVSITGDVVQCTVANPPVRSNDCYKLAYEQYLYCSDIVDQGVGTIDALAASLMYAEAWYFWWD